MICRRCGLEKESHPEYANLCVDCVNVENSRVSYYRQHNYNWMEAAAEADIEVWLRQPEETDTEWAVWLAYRDAYPGVKPSYRMVAEQLGTTVNVVKKVGQRWTFPARLQAWAKYIDELTLARRRDEILSMNAKHIDMATRLNSKISSAIDAIQPSTLTPGELKGLLQLSTELERKARLDKTELEHVRVDDNENPELQHKMTKTDDINEILTILGAAGALPKNVTGIGVRTTTEVILKDDDM